MTLFIFGLVVVAALFILFGLKTKKISENGRVKSTLTWKVNPKQLLCLLGLIIVAASCMSSVPTGHTGIVTTFGKV